MSPGRRSELSTIWRPASCRELKVWKNSSWILLLVLEELDVVDQEHVVGSVALLEALDAFVAQRVDEVVHEGLGGHVADGELGGVQRRVVGDRVQQVGLAEASRSVDEERVVGLPGASAIASAAAWAKRFEEPMTNESNVWRGLKSSARPPLPRPCWRRALWAAAAGSPEKATLTPAPKTAWAHFSRTRP